MGVYRFGLYRVRGQKLTRVLFDEFVDVGVLRYISDGIGQYIVNRIGDIFVGGLERIFNVVVGTIVFGYFVVILRGSDDGDIRFGRDVVAYVVLGYVSIQLVNDDLQINRVIRINYVITRGYLFFQYFLQQETQIAGGGQGNDLIIAGDFCQRLIGTLIGIINVYGDVYQVWILLWQCNRRGNFNSCWRFCVFCKYKQSN